MSKMYKPSSNLLHMRHRPYQPYGAALALMLDRSAEILLVGPAGTGKTRAILEKLFLCMQKYPAMRALLVRKTRASLTQSALVTLEEKVLPAGHPMIGDASRGYRSNYLLANGSELVLGGLDNADRIMSSEYDLIAACEATELTLEDWEKLLTRLRNGVMPYQQAVADCNPAYPTHWLHRRAQSGLMRVLESRHTDNPQWFDQTAQRWTPAGEAYLATLRRLSGARRQRLLDGQWSAAEGLVYEGFGQCICEIWQGDGIYAAAGIDWGWYEPTAVVAGVVDGENRLWIVDEIYESRLEIDDLSRRLEALVQKWNIDVMFADRSRPESIEWLRRRQLPVRGVPVHSVESGIASVESRLMRQSLFVLSGCTHVIEEAAQYRYQADGFGPVQRADHAMDAMRYLIMGLGDLSVAASDAVSKAPGGADKNLPHLRRQSDRIWGD